MVRGGEGQRQLNECNQTPRHVLTVCCFAVSLVFALVQSLKGHTTEVDCVLFDVQEVLVAAGSRGGTIKVWDLRQEKRQSRSLARVRVDCSLVRPTLNSADPCVLCSVSQWFAPSRDTARVCPASTSTHMAITSRPARPTAT